MTFIIFDLEATCWQNSPANMVQEIIEIGAIKLNDFGENEGHFSRFIKPTLHPLLSTFCQQLTHIRQEDISKARSFEKVCQDFQDWIDEDEDDYLLCAWGSTDQSMLKKDCALHRLDDSWTKPFINLKAQYQKIRKLRTPIGLHKAVVQEGFDFTGQHHRAISDAENLVKIFIKHIDAWQF